VAPLSLLTIVVIWGALGTANAGGADGKIKEKISKKINKRLMVIK
jgi:hypothetical protein